VKAAAVPTMRSPRKAPSERSNSKEAAKMARSSGRTVVWKDISMTSEAASNSSREKGRSAMSVTGSPYRGSASVATGSVTRRRWLRSTCCSVG
jgi:hypothetical protein